MKILFFCVKALKNLEFYDIIDVQFRFYAVYPKFLRNCEVPLDLKVKTKW